MPKINQFFNLANPTAGYPYYYRKAAELWIETQNKFNEIFHNPNKKKQYKNYMELLEEFQASIQLIHQLITWLMHQPKTNAYELQEYIKHNQIQDFNKLKRLHNDLYSSKALVMRHTETQWDISQVISGPKDLGLNAKGVERLYTLANNLFLKNVLTVYYSPTYRCQHTAIILSGLYPNMTLFENHDLLERFFGDVSKNTTLQNELKIALQDKNKDFWDYAEKRSTEFPGHEDIRSLNARVASAFETVLNPLIIANRNQSDYLLFVTHGSWTESLATHLNANVARVVTSYDYATPLLFYPYNAKQWDVLNLTKMKFVDYLVKEIKILEKTIGYMGKAFLENGGTFNSMEASTLMVIGYELIDFANILIKHHPRERCPSIDLTHTLSSLYPQYLTKLPSNDEYLKNVLEQYKQNNLKVLQECPWLDENHMLALIDGLSLKKLKEYQLKNLKSIQILIMRYLGLKESSLNDHWFLKEDHLLALKEVILNIGPHPKVRGKIGAHVCGILAGLTPTQVQKTWFEYEHALAVERGMSYDTIAGLPPSKALGLSCGLSLNDMSGIEYSIYHAYLQLSGTIKNEINSYSAELVKQLYCLGLPQNDITCHLNKEGYSLDSIEKIAIANSEQPLNAQFQQIFESNDRHGLLNFVSLNNNFSNIIYQNYTPLSLAVERNWPEVIEYYISKNLNTTGLADYHAELMATMINLNQYSMCKLFIALEINVLLDISHKIGDSLQNLNLLRLTASIPELQSIIPTLFSKIPASEKNEALNPEDFNHSPILFSILKGCSENVKFFLKMGTKINHRIMTFASKGDTEILKIICDQVNDTDKPLLLTASNMEINPLILAAKQDLSKNIALLIHFGYDVNSTDKFGRTALHHAVSRASNETINLLLKQGSDIFKKNIHDVDPVKALLERGFEPTLDYIPIQCEPEKLHRLLSYIIVGGHLSLAQTFIQRFNIDVNACPVPEHFALNAAVAHGHINIIKYLLEIGTNLKLFQGKGSPAFYAVVTNNIEAAELLFDNGADINEQDTISERRSLLMYAIKFKHFKMAELLILRGANVNIRDRLQRTALMYAAELRALSIGKLLLAKGADIVLGDLFGGNAFRYSIKAKDYDFSSLIMSYKNESQHERYKLYGTFSCESSQILSLFSPTPLPFDQESCKEHVRDLKYLHVTEPLDIHPPLALELYQAPSITLPCHTLRFIDKSLDQINIGLACYEPDGTAHHVFPKDVNAIHSEPRDTFSQNCHKVNYFGKDYSYCEGERYSAMSPINHNTPMTVKLIEQGSATLMLAPVLAKMAENFLSIVTSRVVGIFHWMKGTKKPKLSDNEQAELTGRIKYSVKQLNCLSSKLEIYKHYKKIKDYDFALETHQNTLNEIMARGTIDKKTLDEIEELSKDIRFLVKSVDTEISTIDHEHKVRSETVLRLKPKHTATEPKCYLPRFSASCVQDPPALNQAFMKRYYLRKD